MSDSLGNGEGDPTEAQIRLYERWAEGGAAVSIIGEVQGDPRYPERPGNLVLGAHTDQQAIESLVSRATIEFAKRARGVTDVPLMLTGGFRRRTQAVDAVASGTVDMVSLARAMILNPRLAEVWLSGDYRDPEFPTFESPPPNGVTAWYSMRLTALGEDREHTFALDPQSALRVYEERDAQRCLRWRRKFPVPPSHATHT